MSRISAFILCAGVSAWLASVASGQEPMARINLATDGGASNGSCGDQNRNPVSNDGRYVAFSSPANDLVLGDANFHDDIFVRDRLSATSMRVNLAPDGSEADGNSLAPAMSGDGRFVAFWSQATNLVANDTNGCADIFLCDRDPDGNGVFDEGNATTIRVSLKSDGNQSDGPSDLPAISRDGRIVAFQSNSALVPGASNRSTIYAYDRIAGTIELVSVELDTAGGGDSYRPSVSADGSFVAFDSGSPLLIAADKNGAEDIFVRDRVNGVTTRVSVASDGSEADSNSFDAAISGDGRFVAFASDARNLAAVDSGFRDVFVHDRATGATELVSIHPDGTLVSGDCWQPAISDDGQSVVFTTQSGNFFGIDGTWYPQVVLRDLALNAVDLISTGCIGFAGDAPSQLPGMSPDGRFVAFLSRADNLTPLVPSLGQLNAYVRDRATPWPEASRTTYGAGWPGTKGVPSLAADVDPEFGATVDLQVGNSWGKWTVGFLFLGFARDSVVTSKGGTILVDIDVLLPLAIGPGGATLTGGIPLDETLCGLTLDLQAIEQDPGASRGVSFTPGLELIVGR